MRDLFDQLAQQVHAAGGTPEQLHQGMYQAINDRLQKAVTLGFGDADEAQTAFLQKNVQLFSGAKTAHETKALTKLLLDESGAIKPWSAFNLDSLAVHEEYNVRWLNAEYEHAVASAQMAARWQEFAPGDLLSYQTAGDSRVRPEHAAWDNITRPADDDWWNTHYPPNGWLCRCLALVTGVGGKPTPRSILPALPDPDPLFANNVGQTGIIFPEGHPYFAELSQASRAQVDQAVTPTPENPITGMLTVSKSLAGVRKEGFTAAREAMSKVHTLPESPTPNKTLPISFVKMKQGNLGGFRYAPLQDVPPPSLRLSTDLADAGEIGFTLLHELGHWIDYTYLDLPRNVTMVGNAFVDIFPVLQAVEQSELWKSYEMMLADRATSKIRREHIKDYLMKPYEVWARVYSQYIAEQSGNSSLIAALQRGQKRAIADQWKDEDFASIRNALQALFVKKKWTPIP